MYEADIKYKAKKYKKVDFPLTIYSYYMSLEFSRLAPNWSQLNIWDDDGGMSISAKIRLLRVGGMRCIRYMQLAKGSEAQGTVKC